jgi:hypothetical protein
MRGLVLILNRSRKKAPRLRTLDRILLGLGAMLVAPQRMLKVAVAVRPATLLRHDLGVLDGGRAASAHISPRVIAAG